MKVKELMEILKRHDPDMDVGFSYDNYGMPLMPDQVEMRQGMFYGDEEEDIRDILWIKE